ncbi:hypothetical protein DB330_02595 [Lacticaseibacillus casei]|uniref:Uncharacterized protein n=1 Tax=Lacticaseibacillus zeae TaxID=57037 RepID=A0A5R8LTF1_LACZE|nr:hypothetical protein [Lacticaseibacillus casei]TLF40485.1 hypothetical protein FEI15_04175 [Lacticaseibacillus zeae]PTU98443.1 hypothetical protein DB330_02595 [Lacticaseibacillus casei]PTU99579.1 hypothetical protein DB326_02490 [Lacticaseibacillus casei]RXS58364.1 hypothetical protein ETB94_02425 [Lacticaseibacillus casei]
MAKTSLWLSCTQTRSLAQEPACKGLGRNGLNPDCGFLAHKRVRSRRNLRVRTSSLNGQNPAI